MTKNHIAIVGAGLVGSLLAIYLAKRGYKVSLYERRPDRRKGNVEHGRSINLALSTRGIKALEEVGLSNALKNAAIPMYGRMMHNTRGELTFQPYGKAGQFINAIARNTLNEMLMTEAEKYGVKMFFNHRCTAVDLEKTALTFSLSAPNGHEIKTEFFDILIGADGAFSAVRAALQVTDRFNYSQYYIEHGYKELSIPPDAGVSLEKNALHIWPRESYMMIALPNPDGSFTCTLFLPFEGNPSFGMLSNKPDVLKFFNEVFPDAVPLMPQLADEYFAHPTSSLVTIKCFPWFKNNTLLIGDAAHGIVPFYGQGMNAGFEDCRILNQLLDQYNDNWEKLLPEFQRLRKPDADAIAQLAFDNFIEMRDLVADADFLLQKKIEAKLHELYPERWIPLYSMVTFYDNIRYSEAYRTGLKQKKIMEQIMRTPGISENWQHLDFSKIVDDLNFSMRQYGSCTHDTGPTHPSHN